MYIYIYIYTHGSCHRKQRIRTTITTTTQRVLQMGVCYGQRAFSEPRYIRGLRSVFVGWLSITRCVQ